MTVGSTHGSLQSGWTLRLARSWWWPLSLQPKLQGHSPVPHFLLFHRTSHNLTYVLLVCLLSLVPQTMTEEWKLLEGEKFVLFVVISLHPGTEHGMSSVLTESWMNTWSSLHPHLLPLGLALSSHLTSSQQTGPTRMREVKSTSANPGVNCGFSGGSPVGLTLRIYKKLVKLTERYWCWRIQGLFKILNKTIPSIVQ